MLTRDRDFFKNQGENQSLKHKGEMLDQELRRISDYIKKEVIPKVKQQATKNIFSQGKEGQILKYNNGYMWEDSNSKNVIQDIDINENNLDLTGVSDGILCVENGKIVSNSPAKESDTYVKMINGKLSYVDISTIIPKYKNVDIRNGAISSLSIFYANFLDDVSGIEIYKEKPAQRKDNVQIINQSCIDYLNVKKQSFNFKGFQYNTLQLDRDIKKIYWDMSQKLSRSNTLTTQLESFPFQKQFGIYVEEDTRSKPVIRRSFDVNISNLMNLEAKMFRITSQDINGATLFVNNGRSPTTWINQSFVTPHVTQMLRPMPITKQDVIPLNKNWHRFGSGKYIAGFYNYIDKGDDQNDQNWYQSVEDNFTLEVYEAFKRKIPNL